MAIRNEPKTCSNLYLDAPAILSYWIFACISRPRHIISSALKRHVLPPAGNPATLHWDKCAIIVSGEAVAIYIVTLSDPTSQTQPFTSRANLICA